MISFKITTANSQTEKVANTPVSFEEVYCHYKQELKQEYLLYQVEAAQKLVEREALDRDRWRSMWMAMFSVAITLIVALGSQIGILGWDTVWIPFFCAIGIWVIAGLRLLALNCRIRRCLWTQKQVSKNFALKIDEKNSKSRILAFEIEL